MEQDTAHGFLQAWGRGRCGVEGQGLVRWKGQLVPEQWSCDSHARTCVVPKTGSVYLLTKDSNRSVLPHLGRP